MRSVRFFFLDSRVVTTQISRARLLSVTYAFLGSNRAKSEGKNTGYMCSHCDATGPDFAVEHGILSVRAGQRDNDSTSSRIDSVTDGATHL